MLFKRVVCEASITGAFIGKSADMATPHSERKLSLVHDHHYIDCGDILFSFLVQLVSFVYRLNILTAQLCNTVNDVMMMTMTMRRRRTWMKVMMMMVAMTATTMMTFASYPATAIHTLPVSIMQVSDSRYKSKLRRFQDC